jgi:selenocysteine lyase/cysteine desulfurase
MKRRIFLKTMGFLSGGMMFKGAPSETLKISHLKNSLNNSHNNEEYWKIIRQQFVFPKDYAYLNTGGIGAVPIPVLNSVKTMMDTLEQYPRPGHDHDLWIEIKEKCASLLGISGSDELALTNSATEGINIILNGLPLKKGDEIITSTHEHPGLKIPLLNQMLRNGIIIKPFKPDLSTGLKNVSLIEKLITRKTRLIFISHITCTTGQRFPEKEICKLARSKKIWIALDGAQSAGHLPFNLEEYDVDFYATSGHKWILAPKRTGILYVRKELLDLLKPTFVGAYSDQNHDLKKSSLSYHPTAQRYEYATQNETLYHGLGAAIDFINTVGLETIWEHNRKLAQKLYHGLKQIKNVILLSPEEEQYRTAMITFKIKDKNYREAAGILGKKRIRVRVVPEANVDGIRVSVHLYNNENEVERLLNEVEILAA